MKLSDVLRTVGVETKHKCFISYHHENDQYYKNKLSLWAKENDVFIDDSVETGDIPDSLTDEEIREKIRDEYLKNTTVTILLVGTETKYRKHVDWELYSSMYDGKVNKKSGIVVILLPSAQSQYCQAEHEGEKSVVFNHISNWVSITSRSEYEKRFPYMPERIIDNLLNPDAKVSVVNWENLVEFDSKTRTYNLSVEKIKYMIEMAHQDKTICKYDLSRPMRRRNG